MTIFYNYVSKWSNVKANTAFKPLLLCLIFIQYQTISAQNDYWQQHAEYNISVTLDAAKHTLSGNEIVAYTNNSPDTLNQVFYHLYFNAFQPNSGMDVRSRTIADPDSRVLDRINKLKPDEIGKYDIKSITCNGVPVKNFTIQGTILSVELNKGILPGETVRFSMDYSCQIPVQIRRTGRYNKENVAYSMSQWYPKMAEYDRNGWATDPYIGREFYGVWGKFDIYLTLPDSFKVAGTGNIVSQETKIQNQGKKKKPIKTTTYHMQADNVHDFMWAADPHYQIDTLKAKDGLILIFAYKKDLKSIQNWKELQPIMKEAILYASERFGPYPYHQFSFIQGGDGGMEYPMSTLIMGELSLPGLVSVSVHEMMHSWYQGVLGFNESLYAWMDEGFTSYAEELVKEHLRSLKMFPGSVSENPFLKDGQGLINFTKSGKAEPLSIHADHFTTNAAYSVASYVKGALFLSQLGYVVGEDVLQSGLYKFYQDWKFKHPTGQDFMHIMEQQSGMILDWYYQYMINTTMLPDYAIEQVMVADQATKIDLSKKSQMPMPVDIVVTTKDNNIHYYTIPVDLMLKGKNKDRNMGTITILPFWTWTNPTYSCTLDIPLQNIKSIEIDPSKRMLDSDRNNNVWENK